MKTREPKAMKLIHPGQMLLQEFVIPRVAQELGMEEKDFADLCNGKRPLEELDAALLAQLFRNSKMFWARLQSKYDSERLKEDCEEASLVEAQ